jgi:hypothetical protein
VLVFMLLRTRPCWQLACSRFPWRGQNVSLHYLVSLWSSERKSACGDQNTSGAIRGGQVRNLQKLLSANSSGIEGNLAQGFRRRRYSIFFYHQSRGLHVIPRLYGLIRAFSKTFRAGKPLDP